LKENLKYKNTILYFFNKDISISAWLISAAAIVFLHLGLNHTSVLSWDVFGYYLYLPASLIHHDIYLQDYSWVDHLFQQYDISSTFYQAVKWETGNWIIRYTPGMALLYLPFFIIGHLIAAILGFPQDGFSPPYQYAVSYGMLIYPIAGLWYMRKWMNSYFSNSTTALTILILVFGTNFLHLAGESSTLTHVPLFTLYILLLIQIDKFAGRENKTDIILTGFLAGLIILIRPTEAILLTIPLLWKIKSTGLSDFLGELKKRALSFLPAGLIIAVSILPMLIYWKIGSSSWLINSYRNPGEGLDFLDPHFSLFLFSFRKGWLIYTPIALMMLTGLWLMYRKKHMLFPAFSSFFIAALYVSASWTCWWYAGGCYSQRTMVQVYASLAFPLAFATDYLLKKNKAVKFICFSIISALLALNLFQFWQFKHDILDHERMTGEAYAHIFLSTEKDPETDELLLVNRSTGAEDKLEETEIMKAEIVFENDFENDDEAISEGKEINNKVSFIGGEKEFFDLYINTYDQITDRYYFWIRAKAWYYIPENYTGDSPGIVAHFENKTGAYKYRHKVIKNSDLKKGSWNEISMDYLSPEPRSVKDRIKVYLWHPSQEKIMIDSLQVTLLEPEAENPTP